MTVRFQDMDLHPIRDTVPLSILRHSKNTDQPQSTEQALSRILYNRRVVSPDFLTKDTDTQKEKRDSVLTDVKQAVVMRNRRLPFWKNRE